jgi:hypothetical protein
VLAEGWGHLAAAEKAVEADAALVNRVRMAQLPVLFTFLRDWKLYQAKAEQLKAVWPIDATAQAAYDRFMRTARDNQVTGLCEWQRNFKMLDETLEEANK